MGAHGGSYSIYRGLAIASQKLDLAKHPDFSKTTPAAKIGPHPSWGDPSKIVTMDPFGHLVVEAFGEHLTKGYDIRPTIAGKSSSNETLHDSCPTRILFETLVTKAHMDVPEMKEAMRLGRIKPDGKVLKENAGLVITKAAIDPVWYLPGIAKRFNTTESNLRQKIFQETNGMFPELVTRTDLKVFLPPIGGMTIYIFGDVEAITDPTKKLAVRVHDECNGSDVFGSDICTCRPYLTHAIEVCTTTAQEGGAGVVIYFRKEGRALGEVTKYLVYNLRKRQEGGDSAAEYFNCTETVAGIQDVRFQALMPDALHWLGITKIDKFMSMSDMKYDAIVNSVRDCMSTLSSWRIHGGFMVLKIGH